MKFLDKLRARARLFTRAEHVSHIGYFGAIVLSAHDFPVTIAAAICLVLLVIVMIIGAAE